MGQLKAFVVKFVLVGILTFSLFGVFFNSTIVRLLLMTLVVTAVTFIGDLFILPRINQAVAVVADFVALFLLYWVLGNLVVENTVPLILPALGAAYFGAIGEAVFHMYMMDRVHEPDLGPPIPVRYQTEISEESDVGYRIKEEQDTGDNKK